MIEINEIIGIPERQRDSRTVTVSECSTSTHTDSFGALLPVSPLSFIPGASNAVKVPCCGCRDMCDYVHAFDMCDYVQHATNNCAAVSWFCLLQCLLKYVSPRSHVTTQKTGLISEEIDALWRRVSGSDDNPKGLYRYFSFSIPAYAPALEGNCEYGYEYSG